MAGKQNRSRRVGELIQRELATMLMREVKDPRLSMVAITAVDVTRDLGLARVYYTVINSDSDVTLLENVKQGLDKAGGFLRHELGQRIKLRIVPQLQFRYDTSVQHGARLTQLIDHVVAEDKKHHQSSASGPDGNDQAD